MSDATGPLAGVRVLEFTGLGPAPFAGMMLSDLGADVVCVDRPKDDQPAIDPLRRGRRSIAVDLKAAGAAELVLSLLPVFDVLLEGFRPGVLERLGLSPDACLAANPRLVYARMTGWGQDGPMADQPGHDINYLGLTGALHHVGRAGERPVPPVNFVGDFGGGGMLVSVGILAALLEASRSGQGQVVDAAMVDGAALLTASLFGLRAQGRWRDARGSNLIDSGAPFYDVYACADGELLSIGSLEHRFYGELMRVTGVDPAQFPQRLDPTCWPELRTQLTAAFASRPRAEWLEVFEGVDACVSPVLNLPEAVAHAHNVARGTYIEIQGVVQPGPAPRFSRTAAAAGGAGPAAGQHTDEVLTEAGLDPARVRSLRDAGVVT